MSEDLKYLKLKISELERELSLKDHDLQKYRFQVGQLNHEIEKMIEQLSHELEMAHKIQRLLSPTTLPHIQGYEMSSKFIPGSRFGGDYFDVFEHNDRMKFGIILVSASGYSMSSLLLSVLIKVSTQLEARKGLVPHELISLLAREVQSQSSSKDKASVFYGIIDKRNNELTYCSVGNNDAYLQIAGKAHLETLEPGAPHLSSEFSHSVKSLKVLLSKGDRLVLATDGLAKSENMNKQFWGGEGLREAIRQSPRSGVHELRNEILFQNQKFLGSSAPLRDQTVVVVEVKDKAVKLTSVE